MIKSEKQGTTWKKRNTNFSDTSVHPKRFPRIKKHFPFFTFKPVRQGVSPEVMNIADRLIKEYEDDFDYLKDK